MTMKAVAVFVAAVAAGVASATVGTQGSGFLLLPRAAPAGQMTLFGHIRRLTRRGGHFELRFDPAWFTTGLTASRAKLEDTGSSDVPNDVYVIEEGHRLLTYIVPTTAQVTVLADGGK